MASKDFAVLDLQNDNDELNMDLQFQDFGSAQTKPTGGKHEQTIHFTDFPDSAEDEHDKIKPRRKKCKMIKESAENITNNINTNEDSTTKLDVEDDTKEIEISSKIIQNETLEESIDSCVVSEKQQYESQREDSYYSLPVLENNIQISAILPQGVRGPVQLITVLAIKIIDKNLTSKVVKQLSSRLPVPSLLHLKRVRRIVQESKESMMVYLDVCSSFGIPDINNGFGENNILPLNEGQSNTVTMFLLSKGIDISLFSSEVFASQVSEFPSRIRSLYESASQYWPCSFHEDAYLTKLASDDFFSKDEIEKIVRYMNEAIIISGSSEVGNSDGNFGEGVVIVDDERDSIMGRGHNSRSQHPLKHAAIMAVDYVAHLQGGGAWTDFHNQHTGICDLNKIQKKHRIEKEVELLKNKEESSENRIGDNSNNTESKSRTTSEEAAYICTGYDVYSTHEPCMMCAMALLHSRVRRIFFWKPFPKHGALVSHTKLHTLPNINHRYEVFQINTMEAKDISR